MAVTTGSFASLPLPVRANVEVHTGMILGIQDHETGKNSHISARLHTENGHVFVKGLRADHGQMWTQQREADLNPHLRPIAPRLRWHLQADGWDLLGFDAVDGRHADYRPDSPDLPRIVCLLTRLGALTAPGVELRDAVQRLEAHTTDHRDLAHFEGTALLHTDWNPANILITPDGDTHMVDWGWASYGAPWLDAAYWVIWLIAAGHTPASAETWARRVPSLPTAAPSALTAFAGAAARLWREIATHDPQPWNVRIADAADDWHAHRLTLHIARDTH